MSHADRLLFALADPSGPGDVFLALRIDQRDSHVHARVFTGKTRHSLGMCGSLVMRDNEWDAYVAAIACAPGSRALHESEAS